MVLTAEMVTPRAQTTHTSSFRTMIGFTIISRGLTYRWQSTAMVLTVEMATSRTLTIPMCSSRRLFKPKAVSHRPSTRIFRPSQALVTLTVQVLLIAAITTLRPQALLPPTFLLAVLSSLVKNHNIAHRLNARLSILTTICRLPLFQALATLTVKVLPIVAITTLLAQAPLLLTSHLVLHSSSVKSSQTTSPWLKTPTLWV